MNYLEVKQAREALLLLSAEDRQALIAEFCDGCGIDLIDRKTGQWCRCNCQNDE